jgi:hypothetical protein
VFQKDSLSYEYYFLTFRVIIFNYISSSQKAAVLVFVYEHGTADVRVRFVDTRAEIKTNAHKILS